MKKVNIIILILLCASHFSTHAQKTLGGGLGFGTQIESLGIHVDGQFFLNDQFAIAPSVVYYLPKKVYTDFNFKWFEINANVNYYFPVSGDIKPYGVGGINISIISFPTLGGFDFFGGTGVGSPSATKIGLNIGAGADFEISDTVIPFGQIRYNLSSFDQLAIEAGVRIGF